MHIPTLLVMKPALLELVSLGRPAQAPAWGLDR